MEMFSDIRFWMFVWTIMTCVLQWYIHFRLISSDVKKLKEDFHELENKYEKDKKDRTDLLMKIATDLAHIKGQLDTENKIVKILEKIINK